MNSYVQNKTFKYKFFQDIGMQTNLSDYIDISPVVITQEIVDFIRNSKIEIK